MSLCLYDVLPPQTPLNVTDVAITRYIRMSWHKKIMFYFEDNSMSGEEVDNPISHQFLFCPGQLSENNTNVVCLSSW